MPRPLPVITRLNASIEQRDSREARQARGLRILLGYLIVVGIVVWMVLSR